MEGRTATIAWDMEKVRQLEKAFEEAKEGNKKNVDFEGYKLNPAYVEHLVKQLKHILEDDDDEIKMKLEDGK